MKNIRAKVEVLSQEEIQNIHEASLYILEKVGIKVPNDKCLDLCEKAGAAVDRVSGMVRIPAPLVTEAVEAIKAVNPPKRPDDIPGKLTGNISTQIFVSDYKTKTKRLGLLEDVMKGIALVQHLDYVPHCNAVTIPSDVPYNMTDVVSHQRIFTYSKKPGGTYILSPTSAKYIIEMYKIMGGTATYLLETVSPLQFRSESLEMAMVFAEQGQAFSIGPMVMSGATGPVTVAGTITLQNAEVLASIFMVHILSKYGTIYSAPVHSIDMRTMLCSFGAPNQALLGMAVGQMANYYGLDSMSNSGLTDALMPDFQAGFEKASNAIFSLLAGTKQIGAQGIVGADQGISLEQLVIDNEWMSAYNFILKGVEVDKDTIAKELIETVGVGGNFISEEHTGEYMRDNYWPSKLFTRDTWDNWTSAGGKELLERAHEMVEALTAGYKEQKPVIEDSKVKELEYLAKCAGEELEKERTA